MLSDSSIIVSRKSIKKQFWNVKKISLDISLGQPQIQQLYNICLKTVKYSYNDKVSKHFINV